jgi:hypothetical protein
MSSTVPDVLVRPTNGKAGGKILITGIGDRDEDEFALNLLNEQVSS